MEVLVLQSDFGMDDGAVSAMKGVVVCVNRELQIYDLTHGIEPYNIWEAGFRLVQTMQYWPEGTVFVSVVDPGVGSARKSIVAKTANRYIVTPDNGTLTMIAEHVTEVRMIDESVNRLPGSENCFIYHGRDVFAYTAGRLAAGIISYEEVGPSYPVEEIVVEELTAVETVVKPGYARAGLFDIEASYGCLRVNLYHRDFREVCGFEYGEKVHLVISDGEKNIFDDVAYYDKTFGLVPKYAPFICGDTQLGDDQKIRFSLNEENFLEKYAPELMKGLHAAKEYSFTVTKLDCAK